MGYLWNLRLDKKIVCIVNFLVLLIPCGTMNSESTACYGSDGPRCVKHILICTDPLVIEIINTTFGYRNGCSSLIGLSNCIQNMCCKEKPGDCFITFEAEKNQEVLKKCNGKNFCSTKGLREVTKSGCSSGYSAYSKIEYTCVEISTPDGRVAFTSRTVSTRSPLTYQTTNNIPSTETTGHSTNNTLIGGVMGGIIIVIAVLVAFYVYRRKKTVQSKTSENVASNSTTQHKSQHNFTTECGSGVIYNEIHDYDEVSLKDESEPTMVQPTEDNYHHIDETNNRPINIPDNYHHINSNGNLVTDDNYHHISSSGNLVTDDNYHHISSSGNLVTAVNYHHISSSGNLVPADNYHHISLSGNLVTAGNYHHISSSGNLVTGDNYHHISSSGNLVTDDHHSVGENSVQNNHLNPNFHHMNTR